MPICEADPWRLQYFEAVSCPEDVRVPTEDGDAWLWHPNQKWVYNKLAIAESQGLRCAPHGVAPDAYPVFSKPIYNMRGMGEGSAIFETYEAYRDGQRSGCMWMEMLDGEHLSTDCAVVGGEIAWLRQTTGKALPGGMFDYWTVLVESRPEVENYLRAWVREHLPGYTGMLNCETIGVRIIEVHLRFADQWPDLYGKGWVDALVNLYANRTWSFDDSDRREGYSVVLFGAHGVQFAHPPQDVVQRLRQADGISSIQITFHEDRPPSSHSMPPGGFRLAIVNTFDLDLGRRVREELALSFWSTQELLSNRGRSLAG